MFVGSLKSNVCCVRGKMSPRDSLKSALSDQATPRSAVTNLHMDSSRGFLNAVAAWLDPSSLFTHCRPVPENLVCVLCVVMCPMWGWLWKWMPVWDEPACHVLPGTLKYRWPHFELIPPSLALTTTRMHSWVPYPPGLKAVSDGDAGLAQMSAAPCLWYCSLWAGGSGGFVQQLSVPERR